MLQPEPFSDNFVRDPPIAIRPLHTTKLRAEDITALVKSDLAETFHTTDTSAFLKKILAVSPEAVDQVYNDLCKNKIYDITSGRWEGFAKDAKLERAYYAPFINAAQAIHNAASSLSHTLDIHNIATISSTLGLPTSAVGGMWLDRNATPPKSSDIISPAIRPDLLFTTVSEQEQFFDQEEKVRKLEEQVKKLKKMIDERSMKTAKTDGIDVRAEKSQLEKLRKQIVTWWRQVHVPVEVKLSNGQKSHRDSLIQLCGYLRRVLQEQLDRRFVIGLTLCYDDLFVWLCDRSGILGTRTPINIHLEPKKFIQVIAAFSTMKASLLGWDPNMKVYQSTSGTTLPSYRFQSSNLSSEAITWEIKTNTSLGSVITIRALNILGSEVMCGRAMLMWEVYRKDDVDKCTPNDLQIFVLKRYWRSLAKGTPSEGKLYEQLPESNRDAYISSWSDVLINGICDTTLTFIRHSLVSEPGSMQKSENRGPVGEESQGLTMRRPASGQDPTSLASTGRLEERVHTDLGFPESGLLSIHFLDLRELAEVYFDGIKDYNLFYNQGIVQRDVSMESLVITYMSERQSGRLFGLSHAKQSGNWVPVNFFTPRSSLPQSQSLLEDMDIFVEGDVVRAAEKIVTMEYVMSYIARAALALNRASTMKDPITCEELGWTTETIMRPTFQNYLASQFDRTGTVSYLSGEVIYNEFYPMYLPQYFPWEGGGDSNPPEGAPLPPKGSWFHDAIHDMESFFWILVETCLTRRGPGHDMRRVELDEDSPMYDPNIHQAWKNLFFGSRSDLYHGKTQYLASFEKFDKGIITHFHPYFTVLTPLVRKLWHLLHLGYLFRGYEYHLIVDLFISHFEKALEIIPHEDSVESKAEMGHREHIRTGNENMLCDIRNRGMDASAHAAKHPPRLARKLMRT